MVTNATGQQLPVVTAFVSYSHVDREFGRQAKTVLGEVGIDAFLAHEDLDTSEQWQERILSELRRCDLFVPLLSKNFLESEWLRRRRDLLHHVFPRLLSRHSRSTGPLLPDSCHTFRAVAFRTTASPVNFS